VPPHSVAGPFVQGSTCCYMADGCASGGGGAPGRPFVVDSELRVAVVSERSDWAPQTPSLPALSEDDRERLARAWLDDALLEHASIAAFARFTLELLALGAPPALVAETQRAALDEIEHARLCFSAASRYAGRALGPGALDVSDALLPTDIVAFAVRTFEEGCIGETLSALVATEQLAQARDPWIRSLLERIAEDEARHAELAWRAVRWALDVGGRPVWQALERAMAERIAGQSGDADPEPFGSAEDSWHAHGRLTPRELARVRRQGMLEVVTPCIDALSSQFGCPPRSTPTSRPQNRPDRSLPL
jgi:hypothetical protein